MSRTPQPCGTYAAAGRNRRKGEPLCDPCKEAAREYAVDLYRSSGEDQKERKAKAMRTYRIATTRFRRMHCDEFLDLKHEIAEERPDKYDQWHESRAMSELRKRHQLEWDIILTATRQEATAAA